MLGAEDALPEGYYGVEGSSDCDKMLLVPKLSKGTTSSTLRASSSRTRVVMQLVACWRWQLLDCRWTTRDRRLPEVHLGPWIFPSSGSGSTPETTPVTVKPHAGTRRLPL